MENIEHISAPLQMNIADFADQYGYSELAKVIVSALKDNSQLVCDAIHYKMDTVPEKKFLQALLANPDDREKLIKARIARL